MSSKWLGPLLFAAVLAPFTAFAQESTSTNKISAESAKESDSNKVDGDEDVDDLITNNNLRALSGSLSRWSFASEFNYEGGTIETPLAQDRPNISHESGNTDKSDLDGSVSINYKFNPRNSLMAGVGMRWIAPLQKGGPSNYDGTVFDVMNPYLQYQYIAKFFGIQSVSQIQDTLWTQADQTALGYQNQLNFDQECMYEVPKTNISVGASVSTQYQWFNKSGSYGTPASPETFVKDLRTVQSVYEFDFSPIVEYQFNDRYNLRTKIDLWNFEHYLAFANRWTFVHDEIYQDIGIGMKITRDLFVYPNIQFLPEHLSASQTNVGLSVTANMF